MSFFSFEPLKLVKKTKVFPARLFFALTILFNCSANNSILSFSIDEKVNQTNRLIVTNSFITTAIEPKYIDANTYYEIQNGKVVTA